MQLIIEGDQIHDIPSLYKEINRVFMKEESWELGNSLDAFDDLLYGGYGVLKDVQQVSIVWKNMEQSRAALGYEVTKAYYEEKLKPGSPFNHEFFRKKLLELEQGTGETYFDVLQTILANHTNLTLIPA